MQTVLSYVRAVGIRPIRVISLFDKDGGMFLTLKNLEDVNKARNILSADLKIGIKSASEHQVSLRHGKRFAGTSLFRGRLYLEQIAEGEEIDIASNSEHHGSHISHDSKKTDHGLKDRRAGVP